jgi:hypothetical protein
VRIGGNGINAFARRSDDTDVGWSEVASVDHTEARNSDSHDSKPNEELGGELLEGRSVSQAVEEAHRRALPGGYDSVRLVNRAFSSAGSPSMTGRRRPGGGPIIE